MIQKTEIIGLRNPLFKGMDAELKQYLDGMEGRINARFQDVAELVTDVKRKPRDAR